jgi:hypothetical protein
LTVTTEEEPKKDVRALLESEEWKDGPGRKTICEYHKDGLPEGVCEHEEVDDLEYFSDYWKKGGQGKLHSEYHKEGAPFVEEPSDWDGHGPERKRVSGIGDRVSGTGGRGPDEGRTMEDETVPVVTRHPEPGTRNPLPKGASAPGDEGAAGHMVAVPKIERVVDLSTFEVASYAIFRSLFGRGLRIPIRSEGIIDMDLVVKDRDIILNTNQLMFEVPELAIWRLVFAYQGRPVLELGRGVKNRMKIYRWRLAMILLRMWWHGRRKRPAAE